jgi:hypothetical protein
LSDNLGNGISSAEGHLKKALGLHPVQKRRFQPKTTQSDPDSPIAPNWLGKIPTPDQPNQVWVADITYIETQLIH